METGKPVVSVSVIAKVLKSDTPLFREGDIVIIGRHYTESYSVIQSDKLQAVQIIKNREGVPLTAYMGALGWTVSNIPESLLGNVNSRIGPDCLWLSPVSYLLSLSHSTGSRESPGTKPGHKVQRADRLLTASWAS